MLDFSVVLKNAPALLEGAMMTLGISLFSIALGFIGGGLLCLARISAKPWLVRIARVYISALRGTPLLVQLAIVFYFLPLLGLSLEPVSAAIITLAMNTSAFQAEILRGGFQTLARGQNEAAWTIGLGWWKTLRYIQMPQVVRKTLPSLVNETIDIIKNSALISTIAVTDLMRIAQTYSSTTYRPLEFFITAGLMYLLMTSAVAVVGRWVERRMSY